MVISTCCKEKVYTYCANHGDMHYMCYRCDMECSTIALMEYQGAMHDTGRETETQATIG
jgi:hypothetical protein